MVNGNDVVTNSKDVQNLLDIWQKTTVVFGFVCKGIFRILKW
jgi:hypothetical protein